MNLIQDLEIKNSLKINQKGYFLIQPLNIGQGITLGNTLRRTLLSDLESYSITGIRINNLKHEFGVIEGLREDTLEILLNLKEIIFKSSFSANLHLTKERTIKGFLYAKGPMIVTAGLLNLPKNILKIINPSQYICTIINDSDFYLEIDIKKSKGYEIIKETKNDQIKNINFDIKPKTFFLDTNYIPIKLVNYKIKLIHDDQGYIKEALFLEIITNGSLTPKRALNEALKYLLKLFSSLFLSKKFLQLSIKN
jgi:DNA-directed RNA polymerase subunit alpha